MENMIQYGYEGEVFPVNPKANEILGTKAYPSVNDVGRKLDLAIIT
jgi:acyl-CoA synthetase (NDP forming)